MAPSNQGNRKIQAGQGQFHGERGGCEQMGDGEVRKWGGGDSATSLSQLDIITSPACAQITFCGIDSVAANCLLKVIEAKES